MTPLSSTICFSLFCTLFHRRGCFSILQVLLLEVHFCMSHGYPGLGLSSLIPCSLRRSMRPILYISEPPSLLKFCIFGCYHLQDCTFVYLALSYVYDCCTLIIQFSFWYTRVLLFILSVLSIQVKSVNLLSGIEVSFV